MAAEFVVDAGLGKNQKFRDLAKRLMGPANAYSVLIRLWSFAANFRPSGDLTEIDPAEIPVTESEWRALFEARGPESTTGFVELEENRLIVHDWSKSQRWITNMDARVQAARIAGKASARVRREMQAELWRDPVPADVARVVAVESLKPGSRHDPFRDKALEAWLDKGFRWFWSVYPKREKKVEAREAWGKLHRYLLVHGTKSGITKTVKENIAEYIADKIESGEWQTTADRKRYIPAPPVFLNQRRWDDEGGFGGNEDEATDARGTGGAAGSSSGGGEDPGADESREAVEVGPS